MSTHHKLPGQRSFTGNHSLLPASGPAAAPFMPKVTTYSFFKWTLGRGSVIWKIWPAITLHTLFAVLVVYIWTTIEQSSAIEIPSVMLTVMGMIIGFVISYRASSGYDRYWMGRSAWSDIIRNARTMGRLIWYHVPPKLTPGPGERSAHEYAKVMAEKRMALDLLEAFAVALKHHLRGELGIYYEDLYHLVRPLHDFTDPANPRPTVASATPPPDVPIAPPPAAGATAAGPVFEPAAAAATATVTEAATTSALKRSNKAHKRPGASQISIQQPLLPAQNHSRIADTNGIMQQINADMVPFASVLGTFTGWIRSFWKSNKEQNEGHQHRDRSSRMRTWSGPIHPHGQKELERYEIGENLPEEVLRCLSEWVSVLEDRGTVPGASLGSILGGIQSFEVSLTTVEHILTTPLPFVYSVHIRHVVWLFLFLLPFQLVSMFGWHTVPAVTLASFIYLGFLAAGEEIEQPFGYDDNDLDLDMFCRDIICQDVRCLKKARCLNAWFPPEPMILPQPDATNGHDAGDAGKLAAPGGSHSHGKHQMYGGNMYRASLASLSDSVDEHGEVVGEDDTETEDGAEADREGVRVEDSVRTREGELVDVS
ncbi:hypothetical protein HMN09_00320400 [Mycena chlorophos]|uniref:Uncharacterized protein n=1 Tax=Mycena chlorophos TaxID=658473 RepID=A0A8H6TJ42_MYCCL|nr:hypothetical protein HMN09_00320400 [Mycena chlorophos]